MPYTLNRQDKAVPSFIHLYQSIESALIGMPPLRARGYRPLKMTFEEQLKALIFFHLEEHASVQHLLQVFEDDHFAREHIAPEAGIKKSSFSVAINTGALSNSCTHTKTSKPKLSLFYHKEYANLGDLVGIDGFLD